MASKLLRRTKACLRHVPVLLVCVGAILFGPTPALSQINSSANLFNFNSWRWSGFSVAPNTSTALKAPTRSELVDSYISTMPPAAKPSAVNLFYSEVAGTGSFGGGTASLSGLVYCDSNNDGKVGEDEWGIAGAQVSLSKQGSSDAPVIAKSALDGSFKFTGLPTGKYTITMLTPSTVPGTDKAGAIYDKDGKPVEETDINVSTDVISNIELSDGFSGINFLFAETSYPIALISKRMMLASSPGGSYAKTDTAPVPEPSALALVIVAGLAVGATLLRRRVWR